MLNFSVMKSVISVAFRSFFDNFPFFFVDYFVICAVIFAYCLFVYFFAWFFRFFWLFFVDFWAIYGYWVTSQDGHYDSGVRERATGQR